MPEKEKTSIEQDMLENGLQTSKESLTEKQQGSYQQITEKTESKKNKI
jgi:hypothetical protein